MTIELNTTEPGNVFTGKNFIGSSTFSDRKKGKIRLSNEIDLKKPASVLFLNLRQQK
jgi:hypothetical protein